MKEHLAELEPLTIEEKIYKDNDRIGEKNDLDSEAVRVAFRKFDEALDVFVKWFFLSLLQKK